MDQGVIRRKLAAAVRDGPVSVVVGGAERALPLALARAARDGFGLALDCVSVRPHRYSLAELLELPPERALILLLEGPREAIGVLVMDQELLAGLIEAQTLGKVTAQPIMPRKPTRTDAAMVADWVDAVMDDLEEQLLAEEDLVWTDGFRYSSHLDEPRPLALLLEDTSYKVLSVEVDLASTRRGQMILALPADGHGRRPQRVVTTASPDPLEGARFSEALGNQVLEAEVVVQGVLTRVSLPLSQVLALKPGDLLPLPNAALDRIELTGVDGRPRGVGKLGQSKGMRAIRIGQCGDVERRSAAEVPMMQDMPMMAPDMPMMASELRPMESMAAFDPNSFSMGDDLPPLPDLNLPFAAAG